MESQHQRRYEKRDEGGGRDRPNSMAKTVVLPTDPVRNKAEEVVLTRSLTYIINCDASKGTDAWTNLAYSLYRTWTYNRSKLEPSLLIVLRSDWSEYPKGMDFSQKFRCCVYFFREWMKLWWLYTVSLTSNLSTMNEVSGCQAPARISCTIHTLATPG